MASRELQHLDTIRRCVHFVIRGYMRDVCADDLVTLVFLFFDPIPLEPFNNSPNIIESESKDCVCYGSDFYYTRVQSMGVSKELHRMNSSISCPVDRPVRREVFRVHRLPHDAGECISFFVSKFSYDRTATMLKLHMEILERHIEILKLLHHKHIAGVVDTFVTNVQGFITDVHVVMEYCDGDTLYDRITKEKCLMEDVARDITHQVLLAVEFLHSRLVAHCNIEPRQIRFVDKTSHSSIKVLLGTRAMSHRRIIHDDFPYVPPEGMETCTLSSKTDRFAVDIWSIGLIAFDMLFGHAALARCDFNGDYDMSQLLKKQNSVARIGSLASRSIKKKASQLCVDFIASLMAADPSKRLTAGQALQHPWIRQNEARKRSTSPVYERPRFSG